MRKRKYYNDLFAEYPDLVTVKQFARMLGGVNEKTAQKLLRENKVKSFFIKTTYQIPKKYIIDYILSESYQNYKDKLKAQV